MKFRIRDWKPAVDKRVLIVLSGITWSIVGLVLCSFAFVWLFLKDKGFLFALAGLLISIFVHYLGFLRIANTNINRILQMENKVCIFAFQAWKSYLIIVLMMGLGILLRHLPIPKHYLSILYIGIGFALMLSSIRYYKVFFFTTSYL